MGAHPEDKPGVVTMPGAAGELLEEGPGVVIIVNLGEDADSAVVDVDGGVHVFLPDDGEEERAGAVHDGYVGEVPVAVVDG